MASDPRVVLEKARVSIDGGREMGLVYGVPEGLEEPACLVIAPGAGGPMFSPFITYFHLELARRGFLTVKFNFPYMEERKKFPDKPDILKASYARVVDEVRSSAHRPGRLFIGGKSMGGRIASMAAADGVNVDGLFFLGYPLHPPGRTDRLRDEHLYRISKPMLFVSGTNDAFASRPLLDKVVSRIGPNAKVHWVEGGDHSFNTPSGKGDRAKIYGEVVSLLADFASGPNANA